MFMRGGVPWNKGLSTPIAERFNSKVDKSNPEGCWLWLGHRSSGGYGKLGNKIASRISWEITNGAIPEGLDVCHHCDNPPCVNPNHLFLGNASDNIKDAVSKGRINHRGEKNSNAKITYSLAEEIRNSCLPYRKLAEIYGLSKAAIYYIKNNITWNQPKN
jgi:hypothetical protein